MSEKLETILDWCIDHLREGKSIEYCLRLYPGYASELEPLLKLSLDFEKIPKPEPTHEALNLTLLKIGEATAEQRKKRRFYRRFISFPFKINTPALAHVLAILLMVFVIGWTIKEISARSLPGGWFYPIKLSTEKVIFTLTRDAEEKASLRITFAGTRLNELIETIEHEGSLDRSLLRRLLREAALALYETSSIAEESYVLFLPKLSSLNCCQHGTLERLRSRVPEKERAVLDKALEICRNRKGWLEHLMNKEKYGVKERRWGPGCLCDDI
ncbi:MAG: DUF5667 domain-containing protein [bacterium]